MDDQLLGEFLAEAEDLIEELYGDVAALRERRGEGRARRELVGRIFRHVHTLKGSAAAAGLESASGLAHEFETLLDAVRAGRVPVDERVVGAFEAAVEAVSDGLSAVARGHRAETPRALVERLRGLASSSPALATHAVGTVPAEESLPEEIARALGVYERQRLREAVGEGGRLFVVSVAFDLATFDEQFRLLSDVLNERGEVISTLPGMDAGAPDRVSFRIVHVTAETLAEVEARVAPFGAKALESDGGETTAASAGRREDEEVGEAAPPPSAASLTMLVRVSLDELDDLISTTHELLGETVAALDLAGKLAGGERAELDDRAQSIRRRFFELEERLIALRMVPVRATLERAARVGRSAARAAGKEVEFEVTGGDVRLDKSLAERIADPLLHLLRNAVDHGIEPPAERRAAGKAARGRVRIEAAAEGSRVALRVVDDGRGVDLDAVARTSRERGLVAPGAGITEEQALRLIFRPGFSTVASASLVSGRGVGLDAVERTVEQMGGEIRVSSRRGRGTTFEMRLPTTLALIPSHIVLSGGSRYCVAASQVVEFKRLDREDIGGEGDRRTARWRGSSIPLLHMRALLAQPAEENGRGDAGQVAVIIARAGDAADADERHAERHVALIVDGWEGEGEVLVRGLGRHSKRWPGVSGATELGDGTVALVLDLPRLLEAQP